MDGDTADLGSYIESCHLENSRVFKRTRVFDRGIFHRRPQLTKGRTNRIIVYPGCFNPPHKAHQKLLRPAFENSRDINVIAAVILPLDDDRIAAKLQSGHDGCIALTQSERVRLWRGGHNAVPGDWWWVYDRGETEWWLFQRRLVDAVAEDGFDLEFVGLYGTDNIELGAPVTWGTWGTKGLIVSEAGGRPASFVTPGRSRLSRLEGCGPWTQVPQDESEAERRATEAAAWVIGGMAIFFPKSFAAMPLARGELHYWIHLA